MSLSGAVGPIADQQGEDSQFKFLFTYKKTLFVIKVIFYFWLQQSLKYKALAGFLFDEDTDILNFFL